MSGLRSPSSVKTKTHPYSMFRGLDSSRDITALDTGEDQHLSVLSNAACDWRGQIVRDPPGWHVSGQLPVTHINHYDEERLIWVERDRAAQHLRTTQDHALPDAYPRTASVSSCLFNRQVHLASRGSRLRSYDGTTFKTNASPTMALLRPSFMTTVARRLAVAGIPGFETEVHFSRVDNSSVWPGDEAEDETSVLRAGIIDVANVIGTADRITGLGVYEQNRLVIFTSDRAVIYSIDPDIDQWTLDESANIRTGCISHNTVSTAGTDLLFCSRRGIHSIRRSDQNGILVATYTLSDKVDLLYRSLVRRVEDKTQISATFDPDRGQMHVFFPQGSTTTRLTMTVPPRLEEGAMPSFSTADFLNATTASFLSGQLVFGTPGGIYEIGEVEDEAVHGIVTPEAEIVTPYLWHGSVHEEKLTRSIILQAAGQGEIEMDAIDLNGRIIGSASFEIDSVSDDSRFHGVPLSAQYERPWERRYLAAQYRFRIKGSSGLVRITGFAVKTRSG